MVKAKVCANRSLKSSDWGFTGDKLYDYVPHRLVARRNCDKHATMNTSLLTTKREKNIPASIRKLCKVEPSTCQRKCSDSDRSSTTPSVGRQDSSSVGGMLGHCHPMVDLFEPGGGYLSYLDPSGWGHSYQSGSGREWANLARIVRWGGSVLAFLLLSPFMFHADILSSG